MAQLEATIKPFDPADEKLVRFTIGRACMGGLATANRKSTLLERSVKSVRRLIHFFSLLSPHSLVYLGGTVMHAHPVFRLVAKPPITVVDLSQAHTFLCSMVCASHVCN